MKADMRSPIETVRGFSLLEVIVVLALVSAAMVPLFQMQAALSLSTRRALDQTLVSQALDTTLNHFQALNISEMPTGQLDLEDVTVFWSATMVDSHQRPLALYEDSRAPEVRLYSVDLSMADLSNRVIFSDKINLVGWTTTGQQGP